MQDCLGTPSIFAAPAKLAQGHCEFPIDQSGRTGKTLSNSKNKAPKSSKSTFKHGWEVLTRLQSYLINIDSWIQVVEMAQLLKVEAHNQKDNRWLLVEEELIIF